jgi:dipeptidyl aminopeptidase/acylaminoacyl peptidase
MAGDAPTRRPTVDDLLNVRTPADIAIGPDGNVVFSVHATVSERGVSIPSDLWSLGIDGRVTRLTGGDWGDRSPVWSPDGSRLGFLSDRLLRGHHLPYTMALGGEPELAATFRARPSSSCGRATGRGSSSSSPTRGPTGWIGRRWPSPGRSPTRIRSCGAPTTPGADCSSSTSPPARSTRSARLDAVSGRSTGTATTPSSP